ncbi:Riboflavin synthase alpha chain [Candidatus Hodgkinia cicadicola]|uniref:Riboflavin synthase n=1 Tax=Candidatus Hodgkinia cicadicola TaxID=573658 RepID=A0ABX4MJN2_9HYPH|nr:Riboflavin synthase alpha chain [Candidatus Hodgkinia cicadicola]
MCMTVIFVNLFYFEVEAWSESLCLSGLVELQRFDMVNLEEPITLNTPLHGNITNGHSKYVVVVKDTHVYGDSVVLIIECPKWISDGISTPNTISSDGVFLTITRSGERFFEILLIRYTLLKNSLRYFNNKCWFCLE